MKPRHNIRALVEARSTVPVGTVAVAPSATDPRMTWKWLASPRFFAQQRSERVISSNGVTLIVRSTPLMTSFEVLNERKEDGPDSVIHVKLDIEIQPGTQWKNLVLRRPGHKGLAHRPVQPKVKLGARTRVLTVQPLDSGAPWSFVFHYDWQSGASPKEIFGTANLS